MKKPSKPAVEKQNDPEIRYPLELVAKIAAQLLDGENYSEAVRKARSLICECHRQKGEEPRARAGVEALEPPEIFKCCIPRDKALREMTNQDNATDATRCYRELRRLELPNEKDHFVHLEGPMGRPRTQSKPAVDEKNLSESMESRIAKELSDMEAKGVSRWEIENFKVRYREQFPRRCPKPRKK